MVAISGDSLVALVDAALVEATVLVLIQIVPELIQCYLKPNVITSIGIKNSVDTEVQIGCRCG